MPPNSKASGSISKADIDSIMPEAKPKVREIRALEGMPNITTITAPRPVAIPAKALMPIISIYILLSRGPFT